VGIGSMAANDEELETRGYLVNGVKFEAPKRYTVLEPVGQGSYGLVCAVKDEVTQERVAIKKIENVFEHICFTKRTLQELRILRHFSHENLIDVKDIFAPGGREGFEDIYVVSELMETDLNAMLRSAQELTEAHCQFFLYQILRGMKYVHSADVVHRDLKPRNLLVNENCDLKICDFGMARVNFSDKTFATGPLTEYVCTRWYRAPEVLCSCTDYAAAIDVWSIGCIFAEMLGRTPLFPGNSTQHQLQLHIQLLGTPSSEDLGNIQTQKCRDFLEAQPRSAGTPLETVFQGTDPAAIDLLYKVLHFNPDKRVSVKEALQHKFLETLSCEEDEPTREPLDIADFEFELRKLNMKVLREELYLEILHYQPEKRKSYLEQRRPKPTDSCKLLVPGEAHFSSDEEDVKTSER